MKSFFAAAVVLSALYLPLHGQETGPAAGVDPDLEKRAEAALAKAADWLAAQQREDGSWSDARFPALTGLPVWGLTRFDGAPYRAAVERGVANILSHQADTGTHRGAIYQPVSGRKGGGLPNYNTAICIAALAEVDDPDVIPAILKGRTFLSRTQHLGSDAESLFHGGMGYDRPTGRPYADLSNSALAYEAMARTARFEEYRDDTTRVQLNWEAAVKFVQRCQNDPRYNSLPWTSSRPSEQGGFAYRPDEYRENSGAFEEDGVLKFRSMPGMTYAGLLSYIYAGVERDDPRVQAAVKWIQRSWQLEKGNRNPEAAGTPIEKEGLYYLYNILAKGLRAYGRDRLQMEDGRTINWRNELIRKLLSLQDPAGRWVNSNGRYWEADPVLVTSYAMLALQNALAW